MPESFTETQVAVIGGGITGAAITRELSKYNLDVCMLEKEGGCGFGVTKVCQGLLHGGISHLTSRTVKYHQDMPFKEYLLQPFNLKENLQNLGREEYFSLAHTLNEEIERPGRLVLAEDKKDMEMIELIKDASEDLGIRRVTLLDRKGIEEMEPCVNPKFIGGLFDGNESVVLPTAWAIAFAENAEQNGAHIYKNTEVLEINEKKGCFLIKTNNGSFKAEYVVNAAGLYADDIAKMVDAADFEVTGWKAQQLVVENRDYTRRVLCGAPRPQRGRLVIPTTHNSLIVAHTFHPMTNKRDRSTTREGVTELLTWLHEFLPTMSDKHLISAFSGFLTFNTKNPNDHLLESPKRGFITVAVSAPGLGPAPAIAREIVRMLADQGLECTTRSDFNPYRYKAPRFIDLSAWEKNDRIKTEPEYAERFMTQLNEMDLRLCLNTMVTHLDSDRGIVAINPEWGEFKVNPRAVVLAMGCREKSRFSIGIPGSRPAGVFTAGLAQKLVNVDGYMPGESFVILGSGDIGMIMARRLHLERAKVKAVVEIMPHVGGLIRNEVQCLHDFDIPLLLEHTVSEIYGNDRVEGVKIAQVDRDGNVIKETERDVPCDCLLLSVGLIPENELSVEAGIELDDRIGGPIVDDYLQTNIDGIFAAGNVLQVWDLVDNVTLDGEKTGTNAARFVAGELKKQPKAIEVIPGEDIRTITPHRIVGSEDVDFALRVQRPLQDAEVRIGDKTKKFRVLSPTEVVKVTLKPSEMEPFRESGKIEVSCYERKMK